MEQKVIRSSFKLVLEITAEEMPYVMHLVLMNKIEELQLL